MKKYLILGSLVLFLLTLLSLISFSLYSFTQKSGSKNLFKASSQTSVLGENVEMSEAISEEISYWLEVVVSYPDYRDAYMKLAILYNKTGNREKASFYLNKVLSLDPNYQEALELSKML